MLYDAMDVYIDSKILKVFIRNCFNSYYKEYVNYSSIMNTIFKTEHYTEFCVSMCSDILGIGGFNKVEIDSIINDKPLKMSYGEYLKTEEWQDLRSVALNIAKNRCQLCYSGIELNVHHRTYENFEKGEVSDLIVLCRKCHEKHHNI